MLVKLDPGGELFGAWKAPLTVAKASIVCPSTRFHLAQPSFSIFTEIHAIHIDPISGRLFAAFTTPE
ncbi:unnamed protein product [Protopolystoma xenopodis]|uniref:Uncharacterized protein n=1 Tax=Protopolystoma xenopodis TaxID=117903 RepID=A0A448X5Q6_9PLAT|nr:unnamed protein product [Protopolystoma xenopodis]